MSSTPSCQVRSDAYMRTLAHTFFFYMPGDELPYRFNLHTHDKLVFYLCRSVGSFPGILCLPPLLAECICRDASFCWQDVLQGGLLSLSFCCLPDMKIRFILFNVCVVFHIWFHLNSITGLVEFNVFCKLLPHLERGGPWLAVLLCVPGLPVGESWLKSQQLHCFV